MMHSVHRPPYSIKVFDLKEMTALTDYVVNTYFRHYLMYKYAFTKKMRLEFVIENFMPVPEPVVETVPEVSVAEEQEPPVVEEQAATTVPEPEPETVLEPVSVPVPEPTADGTVNLYSNYSTRTALPKT
jgi:hypothetical protein